MRIAIDIQLVQDHFQCQNRFPTGLLDQILSLGKEHEIWLITNNFLDNETNLINTLSNLVSKEKIIALDLLNLTNKVPSSDTRRVQINELLKKHFLARMRPDVLLVYGFFEDLDNPTIYTHRISQHIPTAVILYDSTPNTHYWQDTIRDNQSLSRLSFLEKASLIMTASEFSREKISSGVDIDAKKILCISRGCDTFFGPRTVGTKEQELLQKRYKITKPFILCVPQSFDEHENLIGLLRAFSDLDKDIKNEYQIVVASKSGKGNHRNLYLEAIRLNLSKNNLTICDYISNEDLISLYNLTYLVICPSLGDDLETSALQAIACGAAVIGSNTTSLPEFLERNDILFDPLSRFSMTSVIEKILKNPLLQQELKAYSLVQSTKFSWSKTAKNILEKLERHNKEGIFQNTSNYLFSIAERKQDREILIKSLLEEKLIDSTQTTEDLIELSRCISNNEIAIDRSFLQKPLPEKMTWRIEGPFDSSYSLALINRETARALDKLDHQVILHSTEGPGDFFPDRIFLEKNQDIRAFYSKNNIEINQIDVLSRCLYPPRVQDMQARINMLHGYPWEETGFPSDWVDNFNKYLQGISCCSSHTQRILANAGIKIPLSNCGVGIDHWEAITPDPSFTLQGKQFKFLHVSSCFPRKGIDILLDAYGRAFSNLDNVSLIIKTFPNPHNDINQLLESQKASNPTYPDIVVIQQDLDESILKAIFEQSDVLVAPSRAEGFGLPLAEAMLSGLGVITTNWGGQLDFCNKDNSWLIDYEFKPAQSHFNISESVWAEPKVDHLVSLMQEIFESSEKTRKEKSAIGRKKLLQEFKWTDMAQKMIDSTRELVIQPPDPVLKIGWISTWNVRCGVSTYSSHLLKYFPLPVKILAPLSNDLVGVDQESVIRCWARGGDTLQELRAIIELEDLNTLIIQFNFAFFELEFLSQFLLEEIHKGKKIIMVLHSTADYEYNYKKKLSILKEALQLSTKVLVHSIEDLNRLKELDVIENVILFPHGIYPMVKNEIKTTSSTSSKLIASYGFALPNKGLPELVEAVGMLRKEGQDVNLLLLNADYQIPESKQTIQEAKNKAIELGIQDKVEIVTEFLSDEESLRRLSEADLLVFPYQNSNESASGAVRMGISSKRPVAVTPLAVFNDLQSILIKLPGISPKDLAKGISSCLNDIANKTKGITDIQDRTQEWAKSHSFEYLAKRFYNILIGINR